MLVIAGWTVLTMSITFYAIKKTVGLRVSPEEELEGLDLSEHGLINAYAGLMPDNQKVTLADETATPMAAGVETAPGIPVYDYTVPAAGTLKKVVIITRREMLGALKSQMDGLGISGMTVSYVEGFGAQKGHTQIYRGVHVDSALLPKMKAEIVVSKIPVQDVVEAAKRAIYTGAVGDGKIFIYDVENAFRIRTGQSGAEAVSAE
jgi:Amt family ammonium transporter